MALLGQEGGRVWGKGGGTLQVFLGTRRLWGWAGQVDWECLRAFIHLAFKSVGLQKQLRLCKGLGDHF